MDRRLIDPYINSTKSILKEMAGIEITDITESDLADEDMSSLGVSSTIACSGKVKGRFILDMTPELAIAIVSNMTGEKMETVKDILFLSGISEMNNTIAGDANTYLNNTYSLGLRLAPPTVFTGKNIKVATTKIESIIINCTTDFGALKLNIAFQGGI